MVCTQYLISDLDEGLDISQKKRQVVNILAIAGHKVSVVTI